MRWRVVNDKRWRWDREVDRDSGRLARRNRGQDLGEETRTTTFACRLSGGRTWVFDVSWGMVDWVLIPSG